VDVALVGRGNVQRDRPEHRVARRLEGDRLGAMIEAHATELLGAMRAEQPLGFRKRVQLGAQVVGGTMMAPALVGLERHDLGLHKTVDLILERLQFGGDGEVHG
jgi:hypothetical protein